MATWTKKASEVDDLLKQAGYNNAQEYYDEIGWKLSSTKGMSDQAYDKLYNSLQSRNVATNTGTNPTQSTDYSTIYEALSKQLATDSGTAPTYSSDWTEKVNQLSNAYLNMNYSDYLNSDSYANMAKQYAYNGDKAMKDTLAKAAASTGGLASSYAATAGNYAYNDYMTALEEAARNAYNNERTDAYNNAMMAITNEQNDYGKYQDQLSQYNTNKGYVYNLLTDALNQANTNSSTAYEQALNNAQLTGDYSGMGNYMTYNEIAKANEAAQYNNLLAKAETLGSYGDFSGYKALGYTDAEIANMKKAYVKANTKTSNGNGNGSGVDTSLGSTYEELWQDAYASGNPSNYIKSNYKKYGLSKQPDSSDYTSWKNAMYDDYLEQAKKLYGTGRRYVNSAEGYVSTAGEVIRLMESSGLSESDMKAIYKELGMIE